MIRFDNWTIQADGEILARQFDNLTRTLTVTGDIPAGWEWAVLVQVGNAMDIIPLTATEGTLSVVLTAQQLSIAGCYQMQLRATQGELVKHTNTITVYIPASLSGDEQWPTVPSEFTQMEQRMKGYAEHPPVIGENDTWLLWNGAGYVDSGKLSRGCEISNIAFDSSVGRWVVAYTDGTSDSFAGYDPSNSAVWSIFREDFSGYKNGDDGFGLPGAETDHWRFSDTYTNGVRYGIYTGIRGDMPWHPGQDLPDDPYAVIECERGANEDGSPNRAAFTLQHPIQGEYTLQFDYKPTYSGKVSPGSTETDFFEVWPFGRTDQRFRARVNHRGISSIHVNYGTNAYNTSSIKNALGAEYPFSWGWYRVKICVNVGRIIMKIWNRDSEIEPDDTSAVGVTTLYSEIFSEEYLSVPHEIRFTFGPMDGGEVKVDSWRMGLDNVKIWRGKGGVVDIAFDDAIGRWVTTYGDGSTKTQAGYDPSNGSVWSIFRDDFSRYSIGEDAFEGQARSDWTKDPRYTAQAYLDVAEEGTNKYAVFHTTGRDTRVSAIINHFFQGEYTIQFDYMALTESSGSSGSIFEAWLLDDKVRARINFSGKRNSIHVNQKYSTLAPANTWMPDYLIDTNVWYRVKISVKVGKILMKIWRRDTESEPAEGAAGTVALVSEVITEEQILNEKRIYLVFGPMGTTPATGSHRMGLDNVRVYRDLTEDTVERVLAALPVAEGVSV